LAWQEAGSLAEVKLVRKLSSALIRLSQIVQGAVAAAGAGQTIVIPVYIGQDRIDEIVVKANQRTNFRSGGR
jgi:hypothetical protein